MQAKGKEKRVYRWYATPWEILRQLPDVARHLNTGVTMGELERQARAKSDTQAAVEMQEAKRKLCQFPGEAERVNGGVQRNGNQTASREKTKTDDARGLACLPLVGPERL